LGEVLDTDDQLSATEHQAILKIAQTHGEELSRLGVNVNFAPVVDLSQTGSAGGYSQITQRAISKHPKLVNLVKNIYCFELAKFEITCTLKHFPGLGGVNQDTHLELGRKDGVVADLKEDISAFQTFESDHLVMLSHTIVPAIDPDHPISLSSKGLSWLRDINPRAKTITDDLSMLPISDGYGVKKAYNLARQAGVDYILISYDPELVYELL
jgi:beta-N-acetylhexosaminidase